MNDCIHGIKILSNMIAIRFAENDIFMNVLKTHISKNFSSTMSLRQSTFIFYRENEVLRRKIFLNWMHNLYVKSSQKIDRNMLDNLLNNQKLTICMQIVPKSRLIETLRVFAYFIGNRILFRSSTQNDPYFAFLNTHLKYHQIDTKIESGNYYIDMSECSGAVVDRVKRLFLQKISIAGKSYILMYNKSEFEKFFAKFSSGAKDAEEQPYYEFRYKYQNNYKESGRVADPETLSDSVRLAQYLRMLGCSDSEDISSIKKRFFVLAKEYHPDMHQDKDENALKQMTDKFIQIKNAYDFIVEMKSGHRRAA